MQAQECVKFLATLLTYPTITPQECGIYEPIKSLLTQAGFECLHIDKDNTRNLFAHITLGDTSSARVGEHFCFMGHIDVVPAGEDWSVEPFGAVVENGYIYGRGAQDMKAGVAAFTYALLDFAKAAQSLTAPLMLSLLLTSDEEGEGTYGTAYALKELAKRNLLPTHAIVAEPTCSTALGDTIKNGRRGSINGVLEIVGKQGHAAYPSKCINPIEALGAHLGRLAGVELDFGDRDFAPTKLVITDIRGGLEVVNVTPSALKIMFNVRNSPSTSKESVQEYVESIMQAVCAENAGISYILSLKQSAKPFVCKRDSRLIQELSASIQKVCSIAPECSTSGGTSDARFCQEFGIEAIEFGVCNDRIHSIDERVKITEVEQLYRVFCAFLERFASHCHNA